MSAEATEGARLQSLRDLEILDSEREERFDRITRIVSRILDVPMSAISLVDAHRQWFKSAQGILLSETPRSQAFCDYTIRQSDPLIVSDATADPRFASNPLVTGAPEIRSYAGAPIYFGNHRIGSLCGIDVRPRIFSADQIDSLKDLAAVVQDEMSMRLATHYEIDKALKSTISAMSSTLEMRDPYTAGHEARTGEIAIAIGRALGWAHNRIEGLWLAATVHDTGKISIPIEILTKTSKLSRGERLLMEEHPDTGYRILKDIKFPWPIADIVRQHHEKLDGSGYPQGLSGNDILPEAQVVAIADIVESMALDRPYRRGLGLDAGLSEIQRLSGQKLDNELVRIATKLFTEDGFTLSSAQAKRAG